MAGCMKLLVLKKRKETAKFLITWLILFSRQTLWCVELCMRVLIFFYKGANVTEWRKKRPQFVVSRWSSVNRDILILTAVVSDFSSARLTRKTWTFEDQRVYQTWRAFETETFPALSVNMVRKDFQNQVRRVDSNSRQIGIAASAALPAGTRICSS